jgi:hypothetical protein
LRIKNQAVVGIERFTIARIARGRRR